MKKVILILGFLFIVGLTYAQEQPVSNITETERIVDKYIDKAEDAINTLATALKVPAEHVYSVLVRQQVVNGIVSLVAVIVSCSLFIFFLYASEKEHIEDASFKNIACLIFGVFGFIALFVFFIAGLPSLCNPEYGAIREIMFVLN